MATQSPGEPLFSGNLPRLKLGGASRRSRARVPFRHRVLVFFTLVLMMAYLAWRIVFTLPIGFGWLAGALGIALLLAELLGFIEQIVCLTNAANFPLVPPRPELADADYPDVDILITTIDEDSALLYKTIHACMHLAYPDPARLHITLCDDGARTEMRDLASHLGVSYLARTVATDAKAGNLNNALAHTGAPYVLILDADAIVRSELLLETMPYFFPKGREARRGALGFVQTRQGFVSPDLFQYNLFADTRIPNEQEFFHRVLQPGRTVDNAAVMTGSGALIARAALEAVGGFSTISVTEDIATSIRIHKAGYRSIALPEVYSSALTPLSIHSLFTQRKRWLRGTVGAIQGHHALFGRHLSSAQRLSYLALLLHWYTPLRHLLFLAAPVAFALFGVVAVRASLIEVLIFWLPAWIFLTLSLRVLSRNTRNLRWAHTYETIFFGPLLLSALKALLHIPLRVFRVTNKNTTNQRTESMRGQMAFSLIMATVLAAAFIRSLIALVTGNGSDVVMVLFWSLFFGVHVVIDLLFLASRKQHRSSERIKLACRCTIISRHYDFTATTDDVSESGLSFISNFPWYFAPGERLDLVLSEGRYHCRMLASVVHVSSVDGGWRYALGFTGMTEATRQQLYLLLYDRHPISNPELQGAASVLSVIAENMGRNRRETLTHERLLPRLVLNLEFADEKWGTVLLEDFNYQSVRLRFQDLRETPEHIDLPLPDGGKLLCSLSRNLLDARRGVANEGLYVVDTPEILLDDPVCGAMIGEWMQRARQRAAELAEAARKRATYFTELDWL
ncbi:MAG: glycosyltransferase [Coriobacteriales bacterium]|jgi:cellulose synthase (UDP-forming)|nr:glycosyltransferase [Coriobacteriales bacterium]